MSNPQLITILNVDRVGLHNVSPQMGLAVLISSIIIPYVLQIAASGARSQYLQWVGSDLMRDNLLSLQENHMRNAEIILGFVNESENRFDPDFLYLVDQYAYLGVEPAGLYTVPRHPFIDFDNTEILSNIYDLITRYNREMNDIILEAENLRNFGSFMEGYDYKCKELVQRAAEAGELFAQTMHSEASQINYVNVRIANMDVSPIADTAYAYFEQICDMITLLM